MLNIEYGLDCFYFELSC